MKKCPRCLNTDERYFYPGSKGWYCRKCVPFSRICLEESLQPVSLEKPLEGCEEYTLQFPLTPYQKEISHQTSLMIEKKDVLLKCVCGAGKTEMCLETIASHLQKGRKIGFAIARRQVVLEVANRLQSYFKKARVIAVCGGHTSILEGDVIVLTTHQVFRYYQTFDTLILDEPDAFPFRGNPVLHGIATTSCKGHILYLTATPDKTLEDRVNRKEIECYSLPFRPHMHPLPVPLKVQGPALYVYMYLFFWLQKHPYNMVFVPKISLAVTLYKIMRLLFSSVGVCTSLTEDKEEVVEKFRKKELKILISTTVLERGVTFKDVDVCVLFADNGVFDKAGLVQMAGRAGRNFENPYGDVVFLCKKKSENVERCIQDIQEANHALSVMRQKNRER